ncbi:MAG: prepilin-type N-terminal cleavage/methylation domain-containing protein [Nitrospiraceae bacterium]|nr:prepilin-type N-terminal cleavage/methylation domain-containing protein [Nitrospiraceae bacterium]
MNQQCGRVRGRSCRSQAWRGSDDSGFSLIELLFAVLISGIVMSSAIRTFAVYGHRFSAQQTAMESMQELRLALDVLCGELRLAGAGLLTRDVAFLRMDRQEVEFLANLASSTTQMTADALPGQRDLTVEEATGWGKGKTVVLCTFERCGENRLAADGRKHEITLAAPVTASIPAGSGLFLLNRVRYYLKVEEGGTFRLMRDVDGGASTLLGGITQFRLDYLTRQGTVTADPRVAAHVRITMGVGANGPLLTRDVGLRI